MTRSNPDPDSTVDRLAKLFGQMRDDALDGVLRQRRHGTRQPEQGTRDAEDAWRAATRDAGRKICVTTGRHTYAVVGRLDPTEVRCTTCGREWSVTS